MPDTVDRFVAALETLEASGDRSAIVALFTDDAELRNATLPEPERGREGADRFWRGYREAFGTIRSRFRHVAATPEAALLEWTSVGSDRDGGPIDYDGVSVLELDGEAIRRFRAYFDPRDLGLTSHAD